MKHKVKIFTILSLVIIALFFTNDFGLLDIEKTAIVTAVGIDYKENKYSVSVQIALPEASDTSAKNEKTVVTGEDTTVSGAIKQVGVITGWYPKLSFCNLILLGKSLLSQNVINGINYFAQTLKIQDSAVIAACDGDAKEFLTSSTPLDNISSFSIQKILLKKAGLDYNISTIDIKNFSVGYYSKSASSYMPLIKKTEVDNEAAGGQGSGDVNTQSQQDTGGSSSNSSGESGTQSKKVVFDASHTLLFKKGETAETLNPEETFVYNTLVKKITESTYKVNGVLVKDRIIDVLLMIQENDFKIGLEIRDGKPVMKVSEKCFVRVSDKIHSEDFMNYLHNDEVPEHVLMKAESDFAKTFAGLFAKTVNSNCDLFNLTELLYRYNNRYYEKLSPNLLKNLTYELDVDFYAQRELKE